MSLSEYKKEQAAAKVLEFFKAYEDLSTRYAEILAIYPEAAEHLSKNVPGMAEIKKAGEDLLEKVTNNSIQQ